MLAEDERVPYVGQQVPCVALKYEMGDFQSAGFVLVVYVRVVTGVYFPGYASPAVNTSASRI
jgi:hypothetical protein